MARYIDGVLLSKKDTEGLKEILLMANEVMFKHGNGKGVSLELAMATKCSMVIEKILECTEEKE